jgi:biopolymer transport protein TolR
MAFNPGSDSGPVAFINVVPLVDIMLVLLVIFMVTAPMLQQGVEVDLPRATTGALEGSAEQLVVSIDKDGLIYIGAGNEVSLAELPIRLSAIMETREPSDRKIYIKGDTAISYGRIMDVMGSLYAAGINQIGLVSASPFEQRVSAQ